MNMESQSKKSKAPTCQKKGTVKTQGLTRRTWTVKEEQCLMDCLKEINNTFWRPDGVSFRPGYLKQLEVDLQKKLPGVNLKANPHIESKLKIWKGIQSTISTMLSLSGWNWSTSDYMVTNDSESVWTEYIKKEPNAKEVRKKSFPLYHDWCEIWGNDRATGEFAETPIDAAEELQQGRVNMDVEYHDLDAPDVGLDDIGVSVCMAHDKILNKKGTPEPRKRKRVNEEIAKEMNKNLEQSSTAMSQVAAHFGDMVSKMGHEKDLIHKREELDKMIRPMGLSVMDRVRVAGLLSLKPQLLDCFCGLEDEESRFEMVNALLMGTFG